MDILFTHCFLCIIYLKGEISHRNQATVFFTGTKRKEIPEFSKYAKVKRK